MPTVTSVASARSPLNRGGFVPPERQVRLRLGHVLRLRAAAAHVDERVGPERRGYERRIVVIECPQSIGSPCWFGTSGAEVYESPSAT